MILVRIPGPFGTPYFINPDVVSHITPDGDGGSNIYLKNLTDDEALACGWKPERLAPLLADEVRLNEHLARK